MFNRLGIYFRLMRFHRPWPLLLILFPTYWGLFLGPNDPNVKEFLVFTVGAVLARAAGCVINDYFDREIDGRVKRTQARPLQKEGVKPREAVILFLVLMTIAFCCVLLMKWQVIALSFVAFFFALFYPLAKRFTYFPQIVLGIAFNFGIIMADFQINNHVSLLAWGYYAFSILWTVHYDTLYALSDYQDDLKIGVKSIATFFKERVYTFLAATSVLQVLGLGFIWIVSDLSWIRILLLLAFMVFLALQYTVLLQQRTKAGMKLFTQNVWIGALTLLGVLF